MMFENKTVAFFVSSLQSGGAENYLLRFIEEFHGEFQHIVVFCKSGKGGQLERYYNKFSNVEIVKREIGYLSLKDYLALLKFFDKYRFGAVCDFTGNFAGLVLHAATQKGVNKRIAFYRNSSNRFEESALKKLYDRFVHNLVLKCATGIFANSIAAFNFYYPKVWETDKRFGVIYNGINANQLLSETGSLKEELRIPEEAFVIGHTGRFNPAKNHSTILEVAKKLLANNENIYFIMCGNGVKANLQKQVDKLVYKNRILLFENRDDIPKFLNTMDCYYFPSVTEGQPNALIEAMVMGLPVVTSNIAPIKETVPESFHFNLIDPLDVNAAVNAILKIYQGEDQQDLQTWSIQNFDSKVWFTEFFKKLI